METVPPPAGEDDAYSAPTKVGAMAAAVVEEMVHAAARKAAELAERPAAPTPSSRSSSAPNAKVDAVALRDSDLVPAPTKPPPPLRVPQAGPVPSPPPPPRLYTEDEDDDAATLLSKAARPTAFPVPPVAQAPLPAPPPPAYGTAPSAPPPIAKLMSSAPPPGQGASSWRGPAPPSSPFGPPGFAPGAQHARQNASGPLSGPLSGPPAPLSSPPQRAFGQHPLALYVPLVIGFAILLAGITVYLLAR